MSLPNNRTTARKSTSIPYRNSVALIHVDDSSDEEESDHDQSSESEGMVREAEKILAKRVVTQTEYRIKWKDCSDFDNTWTREEVLRCPNLIATYEKDLKDEQENKIRAQKRAASGSSVEDAAEEPESKKKIKIVATEETPTPQSASGDDENLIAEKIVAATRTGSQGELNFLVKWQDKSEATLVSAHVANLNYPQIVINFYEERLKVSPEQWITA